MFPCSVTPGSAHQLMIKLNEVRWSKEKHHRSSGNARSNARGYKMFNSYLAPWTLIICGIIWRTECCLVLYIFLWVWPYTLKIHFYQCSRRIHADPNDHIIHWAAIRKDQIFSFVLGTQVTDPSAVSLTSLIIIKFLNTCNLELSEIVPITSSFVHVYRSQVCVIFTWFSSNALNVSVWPLCSCTWMSGASSSPPLPKQSAEPIIIPTSLAHNHNGKHHYKATIQYARLGNIKAPDSHHLLSSPSRSAWR